MQLLPITPVKSSTPVLPVEPHANRNPGIVPPWLQRPVRNPGIVPPWLQDRPVGPSEPVADDVPRILGSSATGYDPAPIVRHVPRSSQG